MLGAACIPIGALWDISWHSTIGRDTCWSPPHMALYLGLAVGRQQPPSESFAAAVAAAAMIGLSRMPHSG